VVLIAGFADVDTMLTRSSTHFISFSPTSLALLPVSSSFLPRCFDGAARGQASWRWWLPGRRWLVAGGGGAGQVRGLCCWGLLFWWRLERGWSGEPVSWSYLRCGLVRPVGRARAPPLDSDAGQASWSSAAGCTAIQVISSYTTGPRDRPRPPPLPGGT
jgi:hypothetical protein